MINKRKMKLFIKKKLNCKIFNKIVFKISNNFNKIKMNKIRNVYYLKIYRK